MVATRVLFAAGLETTEKGRTPRFVDLAERNGSTAPYLLNGDTIQECNLFKPRYASWFINNTVLQDGSLYISTPVDILFLLLPALETASSSGSFCDLEHCMQCLGCSPTALTSITSLITHSQLQCLCDSKDVGGQFYYRLCEQRVLAWLRLKVAQTKAGLSETASGFAEMDDRGLTVYAVGVLGEYITPEWAVKLSSSLCLPDAAAGAAVGPSHGAPSGYNPDSLEYPGYDQPSQAKRPRFDPKEAAKAKAAEARAATKAAKIAKEASGMRKLSSFFMKK